KPDAQMRHVGYRGHQRAVRFQVRLDSLQNSQRIPQMFEHVGDEDGVESVLPKLLSEIHAVQIADNDAFAKLSGALGRTRIDLDANHLAVAVAQDSRYMPGRAPELQNPLPGADQADSGGVRTTGIHIDFDVVPRHA